MTFAQEPTRSPLNMSSQNLLIRRKFDELHPRDKQTKTNRRARIETNWGANIQDCIPQKIRPRVELKKGAKIRVGDLAGIEEIWWNWSVEVLRGLEELSTMLAGKLKMAQDLMMMEVSKRQSDPRNPQRRVAELLLGDVQRVCDNVKRCQANEAANGESSQQDVNMEELEREPQPEAKDERKQQPQAGSPIASDDGLFINDAPTPTPAFVPQYTTSHGPTEDNIMAAYDLMNSPIPTNMPDTPRRQLIGCAIPLGMQSETNVMRARASRLRAAAMRLEAEAAELESNAIDMHKKIHGL